MLFTSKSYLFNIVGLRMSFTQKQNGGGKRDIVINLQFVHANL